MNQADRKRVLTREQLGEWVDSLAASHDVIAPTEVGGQVHFRIVKIDYVARVEGETAIRVRVPGDGGPPIELRIFEPPRFFEGFLVGRRYDEVGDIVSRICGICPVSHMLTAIRALEKATGITPSPRTVALRRVGTLAQIAASHLVHLYALAMPDYVGRRGLPDMLPAMPADVGRMLRMRDPLNQLTAEVCGGRALHPIGAVPGGFTMAVREGVLHDLRERLIGIRDDARATVRLVAGFKVPPLIRKREFAALSLPGRYAMDGGDIVSTGGLRASEDDYLDRIEEEQVPYAMAMRLHVKERGGLMTGALARMNVKGDALRPAVREVAEEVGFTLPDYNPFHNNLAQALELFQAIEDCIELLGGIGEGGEEPAVPRGAGYGVAVTEAPRGLLCHAYGVNRRGLVESARIITPTVHNFQSIEDDLEALATMMGGGDHDGLRLACEMLVRAYDPCFSCSVH